MSTNENDTQPPSYSEYIQPSFTGSSSRGQNILDQLTLVRSQNVRWVIDSHILPLVEQQAAYGIAQTIIALLPSDVPLPAVEEKNEFSFDTAIDSQKVEVIGFSSDESPKIVRLEGQLNKTEVWRPQVVINELERRLQECLNDSEMLRPRSPVKEEPPQRQVKRRFFDRVTGRGPEVPSPSGNPEVGVRQAEVARQVLVKVRLEEICLRTVNEFGIYDTMSTQCVIIRVDARC